MTPSVPSDPRSSRSGDGPAPDAGRLAGLVDLEDAVHLRQVQADGRGVFVAAVLNAPDHGRPAAVRDDRGTLLARPREEVDDVLLGGRSCDHVGRMLQVAVQRADDVAVGLAVRVGGAVGGAGIAASDAAQHTLKKNSFVLFVSSASATSSPESATAR